MLKHSNSTCDRKTLRSQVQLWYYMVLQQLLSGTTYWQICWTSSIGSLRDAVSAFAAERGRMQQISMDKWAGRPTRGALQQTIAARAAAAVDRWGRHTDRRTDTRPLHRPYSAYCAGSLNLNNPDRNSHASFLLGRISPSKFTIPSQREARLCALNLFLRLGQRIANISRKLSFDGQ